MLEFGGAQIPFPRQSDQVAAGFQHQDNTRQQLAAVQFAPQSLVPGLAEQNTQVSRGVDVEAPAQFSPSLSAGLAILHQQLEVVACGFSPNRRLQAGFAETGAPVEMFGPGGHEACDGLVVPRNQDFLAGFRLRDHRGQGLFQVIH